MCLFSCFYKAIFGWLILPRPTAVRTHTFETTDAEVAVQVLDEDVCRRYYVDVGDRLGLVAPAFRDVLDGEDRGGHGSC